MARLSDEHAVRLAGALLEGKGASIPARPSLAIWICVVLAISGIVGVSAQVSLHDAPPSGSLSGVSPQEKDMKFTNAMSVAVIASSVCSGAMAQDGPNLVANGGLEGGSGSGCIHDILAPGSSAIPGWVVSGNWSIDWMGEAPGACECSAGWGARYVDLNGSPNWVSGSAIKQSVSLTPGTNYRISCLAVPNDADTTPGTIKILRITIGSQVSDFELVTPANSCTAAAWDLVTLEYTPTQTVNQLEFRSTYPNSAGGILLDDISVVAIECPGDIIQNGTVDAVDLAALLTVLGSNGGDYPRADINHDGVVAQDDLTALLAGWGVCP